MFTLFAGLFQNTRAVIISLLIAALCITAGIIYFRMSSMQNTITELTAEKAQLIANEVVLRSNIDTVKANLKAEREANAANMATIDKLLEDRKDAQQQIKKLADLKAKNKRASDALNKNVEEMLKKDPKNNGPLSPVLKETIRGIQRQ